MKFNPATDIPSLAGKVAIVTGANTGIGRITALELARKGAHTFLACRSADKTLPVIEDIKKQTGNEKVEFLPLDLSDLKSVDEAVKKFLALQLPLHLLVNNAGVMAIPKYTPTKDDIEMQWGTNHVGHFQFTNGLLSVLEKSAPSRIVNVSSSAHQFAKAQWFASEETMRSKFLDPANYNDWQNYGVSKVSNQLFSIELNRRLQEKGIKQVYVNSVHPGVINTELSRYMGWFVQFLKPVLGLFLLSPEKGAVTSLYVATSPDIEAGEGVRAKYFVPFAKEETPTGLARDLEAAARLWSFTEKIVAEKWKQ